MARFSTLALLDMLDLRSLGSLASERVDFLISIGMKRGLISVALSVESETLLERTVFVGLFVWALVLSIMGLWMSIELDFC